MTEELGDAQAVDVVDRFVPDVEHTLPDDARARSGAGEVLVTREIVDAAGPHLEFEHIGDVRLKGFSHVTELFLARLGPEP
ncbi:MAG TPA: hypothetical protein VNT54_12295 [Solirubrobacteraceae bacterium]|nr:hypothetical protein [Solirubrobacteraceae bacterium]